MSTWESQFRKGLAELAILAVIARNEAYGYKVVESLASLDGLNMSESTVYPILTRLFNEGLLSVRVEASPAGPPRRMFSINAQGHKRLRELTATWGKISRSLSDILKGAGP